MYDLLSQWCCFSFLKIPNKPILAHMFFLGFLVLNHLHGQFSHYNSVLIPAHMALLNSFFNVLHLKLRIHAVHQKEEQRGAE